jgi:hypothetical protein
MPGREHLLRDHQLRFAVGPVLVALAALVLHDLSLPVELGLIDGIGQRGHAIGLQPQKRLQEPRRPAFVIIGAVVFGGGVVLAALGLHDEVEQARAFVEIVGYVLRAHEHQVLE